MSLAEGANSNIERDSGIIRNVALISMGAAKGHEVLVDDTTLNQVQDAIPQSGLKVRFNPNTFQHTEGGIAGIVPKQSVKLDKQDGVLRGDLHLLKSYPYKDYIFELAEEQPESFGLSIEFNGDPEEIGGVNYARCEQIFAVTVVDEPAANATGLFRALDSGRKQNENQKPMTKEEMAEIKAMMSEAVGPVSAKLGEMESQQKALATKFEAYEKKSQQDAEDEEDPDTEGMSEEDVESEAAMAGVVEGDSKMAANRKVHRFRRNANKPVTFAQLKGLMQNTQLGVLRATGGRAMSSSAGTGGDKPQTAVQRFAAIVKGIQESSKCGPAQAQSLAMKQHPEVYSETLVERGIAPAKKGAK